MVSDVRHFLRLLSVELLDLIEDVTVLIDSMERRFANGEITAYVKLENEALFNRERDAFAKFAGIVDGIDPSIYKDIPDMEVDLLARSRDFVTRLEDPEAVFLLIKRKFDKVKSFISSDDSAPAST